MEKLKSLFSPCLLEYQSKCTLRGLLQSQSDTCLGHLTSSWIEKSNRSLFKIFLFRTLRISLFSIHCAKVHLISFVRFCLLCFFFFFIYIFRFVRIRTANFAVQWTFLHILLESNLLYLRYFTLLESLHYFRLLYVTLCYPTELYHSLPSPTLVHRTVVVSAV